MECDIVLVIGSINSSNSNRLKEIAERSGVESYLIDSSEDLDHKWLEGKTEVGITSGASAPEHLVKELVSLLQDKYNCSLFGEEERADEGIFFRLPKGLRNG